LPRHQPDLKTTDQAAEALGITHQAVGQWGRRPGAPVRLIKGKTWFEWPAFPRWREAEIKQAARDAARPKDRNDAEERMAIAKAQLAELELEEARNLLARKEDVQRAWRATVERFVSRGRALPPKAAPALVGMKKATEAQIVLERYVEELVGELRDYEGTA
jgi:hypothetical protein